ncbi:aminotransferase class I/II-fold pyridoxal phosphate-dependent enzyme [Virgibacillus halophilus]|uniref:Aminotransferase class I/II-fold pyridoxal phosphate-dependent enzyme n=1 Tax=Tigheibacillus halophilus TaxID=361280 RepID=A0ABU5C5B5_9BACI|nr:aminotransferase class I/II-fold pyridoxal phosphate-dependent enzyme [Virgibacillus halophilus]
MLTPSCTAALEMAAILTNAGPGDEVIMPSYTFVSTANAFALRGGCNTICRCEKRNDEYRPGTNRSSDYRKDKSDCRRALCRGGV